MIPFQNPNNIVLASCASFGEVY